MGVVYINIKFWNSFFSLIKKKQYKNTYYEIAEPLSGIVD